MDDILHQQQEESIAAQIIALLAKLRPSKAMQIKPLRCAVLNFIEHSDISVHNEITTRLRSDGRPSKRRKKDNPDLGLEKQDQTLCKQAKAKSEAVHLQRALKTLQEGCKEPSGTYERLLSGLGDGDTFPLELNVTEISNRQQTALRQYRWSEQTSHTFEGLRRLDLLRIVYEIDRLQPTVEREATSTGDTESDVAAAQRKFAELSGSQVKSIKEIRRRARPYAEWALRENGLGILLMLGNQTRKLWERDLSNESISCVWNLCSSKHQQVLSTARTLQPIACRLLERRFATLDSTAELREDGHIFSRHFRQRTYLDALAVAANQVQAASTATNQISNTNLAVDACAEFLATVRSEETTTAGQDSVSDAFHQLVAAALSTDTRAAEQASPRSGETADGHGSQHNDGVSAISIAAPISTPATSEPTGNRVFSSYDQSVITEVHNAESVQALPNECSSEQYVNTNEANGRRQSRVANDLGSPRKTASGASESCGDNHPGDVSEVVHARDFESNSFTMPLDINVRDADLFTTPLDINVRDADLFTMPLDINVRDADLFTMPFDTNVRDPDFFTIALDSNVRDLDIPSPVTQIW